MATVALRRRVNERRQEGGRQNGRSVPAKLKKNVPQSAQ